MNQTTITAGFQTLPLTSISPSPNNYRRSMDKKALKELTKSVAHKGVLQPILVRPMGDAYEIVAGHRRYQAATVAKLEQIPVMVKELTDEEALEVQVIENCQREDPNPMDEAWGFKALLDLGAHTPDTLAAKLDRSKNYVYSRLRLLDIPEAAQNKIASAEISLGQALVLTRVRNDDERGALLRAMTDGSGITVKRAQEMANQFSTALKDAVFDLTDCAVCPYRTKNQTVLFPELKKTDECMDRKCFFEKTYNHYLALINKQAEAGFKTIIGEDEFQKVQGSSVKIAEKSDDYYIKKPKEYKMKCSKCKESHAWYLSEVHHYQGRRVAFGELCLDMKCFNRMQFGEQAEAMEKDYAKLANAKDKAEQCRNRFLAARLPERVADNQTLQKRLILFHLLSAFPLMGSRDRMIMEYAPGNKTFHHGWNLYPVLAKVPEDRLDEFIFRVLVETTAIEDPKVLLNMTPEAGIDINRDFVIDEAFLNTKTKEQLMSLVSADLHLPVVINGTEKKAEMVKAILAVDLVGKLPKEIAEVCKLEDPTALSCVPEPTQAEYPDGVCEVCGGSGGEMVGPGVCRACKDAVGLRVCKKCGAYCETGDCVAAEWATDDLCSECATATGQAA